MYTELFDETENTRPGCIILNHPPIGKPEWFSSFAFWRKEKIQSNQDFENLLKSVVRANQLRNQKMQIGELPTVEELNKHAPILKDYELQDMDKDLRYHAEVVLKYAEPHPLFRELNAGYYKLLERIILDIGDFNLFWQFHNSCIPKHAHMDSVSRSVIHTLGLYRLEDVIVSEQILSNSRFMNKTSQSDIYHLYLGVPSTYDNYSLPWYKPKAYYFLSELNLNVKIFNSPDRYKQIKQQFGEYIEYMDPIGEHVLWHLFDDETHSVITHMDSEYSLYEMLNLVEKTQLRGLKKSVHVTKITGEKTCHYSWKPDFDLDCNLEQIVKTFNDSKEIHKILYSEEVARMIGKFHGIPAPRKTETITKKDIYNKTLCSILNLKKKEISKDKLKTIKEGLKVVVDYLYRFPKTLCCDMFTGNFYVFNNKYEDTYKHNVIIRKGDFAKLRKAPMQLDVATYILSIPELLNIPLGYPTLSKAYAATHNLVEEHTMGFDCERRIDALDDFLMNMLEAQTSTASMVNSIRKPFSPRSPVLGKYTTTQGFKQWKVGLAAALFLRGTIMASYDFLDKPILGNVHSRITEFCYKNAIEFLYYFRRLAYHNEIMDTIGFNNYNKWEPFLNLMSCLVGPKITLDIDPYDVKFARRSFYSAPEGDLQRLFRNQYLTS